MSTRGASPPLDGPDGASILARSPGAGDCVAIRGSYCRARAGHHTAVRSPLPIRSPPCPPPAAEGTRVLWSMLKATLHHLSLAACPWSDPTTDSGLPLLLREPQGQPLSSAPSGSSPWQSVLWVLGLPHEEVEQAQGQWPLATLALGCHSKGREGQLSLSHQSPL